MPDPITFRSKRAEKLAERGCELLRQGDYREALEVASRLEELRDSAALGIAAQAHEGLGETAKAIEVLERGLEVAADAWPNWQLLGNLRSDAGDLDGADEAYERALGCPGAWEGSIRLNQGVLLNRRQRFDEALEVLGRVADDELRTVVAEAKMYALEGSGRLPAAVALGQLALEDADRDAAPELTVRLAALVERLRLKQGAPREEIRRSALGLLRHDPSSEETLALIRDTYERHSPGARLFRVVIHGRAPAGDASLGYYATYHVVADSPENALGFVEEIEAVDGHGDCRVEDAQSVEDRPSALHGVYWRSGRILYDEEAE